jgi:hypothetical protein
MYLLQKNHPIILIKALNIFYNLQTWVLCISEITHQQLLMYNSDIIDNLKADVTYLTYAFNSEDH